MLFPKQRGTTENSFQIGIGALVALLKNVSGKLALRNKADNDYIELQTNGVEIFDSGGINKVTIRQTTLDPEEDIEINLPADKGSAGQVVATDGNGNWFYVSAGSTTECIKLNTTTVAFGSSSPVSLFTLPSDALIAWIKIFVDTAFDGTAPTLSVGISGNLSKYVGTGDLDLKTVAQYKIEPSNIPVGTSEALIATYSADGSTAGSARIVVAYGVPNG